MSLLLLFLLLIGTCASAITMMRTRSMLRMSTMEVHAREMELTSALKGSVDTKIGNVCNKLGKNLITSVHVVLKVHKHPTNEIHSQTTKKDSQVAEVTVHLKGGNVIHNVEKSNDMYVSIGAVAHKIAQSLKKEKQKMSDKRGNTPSNVLISQGMNTNDEDDEDFDESTLVDDPTKISQIFNINMDLVKQKSFDMPPITIEQAKSNLMLIDHDFYVFRNSVTNDINVIYKRKDNRGIGLISPEKK